MGNEREKSGHAQGEDLGCSSNAAALASQELLNNDCTRQDVRVKQQHI